MELLELLADIEVLVSLFTRPEVEGEVIDEGIELTLQKLILVAPGLDLVGVLLPVGDPSQQSHRQGVPVLLQGGTKGAVHSTIRRGGRRHHSMRPVWMKLDDHRPILLRGDGRFEEWLCIRQNQKADVVGGHITVLGDES